MGNIFLWNMLHNLPQIIYSSIISAVINELIKLLSLTEITLNPVFII